ncbi:MAG: hypothetical protein QNL33_19350 [Akkermansiaceae bacterium]
MNTTETSGAGGFGITGYIEHSTNLIFDFQTLVSASLDEIVGAWQFEDSSSDDSGLLVFQSNGIYFHGEVNQGDPSGQDGMARGTYTWNKATEILSATPITDTNLELGLSHPLIGYDEVTVTGDVSLRIYDGESFFLHRVSNAAILQDWRINKARNFTQIAADTAPTTANFGDLWALVETPNNGDLAAVTISGGKLASPRPFDDEGESSFELEFVRRVGSSLRHTPQRSDSLSGFVEMAGALTITPIAGGEFERVIVSEPCDPALVPRCFGRVLVTVP